MSKDISAFTERTLSNITKYKYNPSSINREMYLLLEEMLDGKIDLVDPTNPFTFLLEASAVTTSIAIEESLAVLRKQYPLLADEEDDLYRHMSDKDYMGRFVTPSSVKVTLVYNLSTLKNRAVKIPDTDILKITIPAHTIINIENIPFAIDYPIDILIYANDNVAAKYDISVDNPISTASSVLLNSYILLDDLRNKNIYIDVNLVQYKIDSEEYIVTSGEIFSKTIPLADEYYYSRVYIRNDVNSNTWTEVTTTHNDYVYDVRIPTVSLKVLNDTLEVTIPQVYIANGSLVGNLRVDTYTSKGMLDIKLSPVQPERYTIDYRAIDETVEHTVYTAGIANTNLFIFSNDTIDGGSDKLTFDELKDRVIENTVGIRKYPVTDKELYVDVLDKGFEVSKALDTLTHRLYAVYKDVPDPTSPRVFTRIESTLSTLLTTIDALKLQSNVVTNDDLSQLTILSNTIYVESNGMLATVPDTTLTYIDTLSAVDKAKYVSDLNVYYNPFYYNISYLNDGMTVRVYDLDGPVVDSVDFVDVNSELGVSISTGNVTVEKTDTSYKVIVTTSSGDLIQSLPREEIEAQLVYKDKVDGDDIFIPGVVLERTSDNEWVFVFTLDIDYAISQDDSISITNGVREGIDGQFRSYVDLTYNFNIIYVTNSPNISRVGSSIDDLVNRSLVSLDSVAISQDVLRIRLGTRLDKLWSRHRSSIGVDTYTLHTVDVPLVHANDVYEIDPVTGSMFTINAAGELVYTLLHSAGSPVLDLDGNPVYKYKVGDVLLDSDGAPVIDVTGKIQRHIDLYLLEGLYAYADNSEHKDYRNSVREFITRMVTTDVTHLNDRLLEFTDMLLSSKKTTGRISVNIGDGSVKSIDAKRVFEVQLYVDESVTRDDLRMESIRLSVMRILSNGIKSNTYNRKELEDSILESTGDSVVGISLLAKYDDYPSFALTDPTTSLSLKKKLIVEKDRTLSVLPDVKISFTNVTT